MFLLFVIAGEIQLINSQPENIEYDYGIRVNLGGEIGSGHFYRCLAIANELTNHNKKVVFLIKNEEEFISHIGTKNYPYIVIEGNTQQNELINCKERLSKIKNLIIDVETQNQVYSKYFQKLCNTAIIDDLGGIMVYSEILFNGHMVKKFHCYEKADKNTKIFLGPNFMPLRDEFLQERKKVTISKKPIERILISFGGSDDFDLTSKIARFFINKNYEITFVLGPSYKKKRTFQEWAEKYSNFHIKNSVKNMANLFTKHDLVISSAGITTYELACLGIPSIFIPMNSDQGLTAKEMMKFGFGIDYGACDNEFTKLDIMINEFDYQKREKMFEAGRKIVDGKGSIRISENLRKLWR